MPGLVDVVRGLLNNSVGEYANSSLLLLPVLYMVYRRLYCRGFGLLRSLPAGAGKQGDNWLRDDGEKSKSEGDVEITWLGSPELKQLQAFGDTLLPGFEVGTVEAADAAVEQVGVGVFTVAPRVSLVSPYLYDSSSPTTAGSM